jgi:hypothetical protein
MSKLGIFKSIRILLAIALAFCGMITSAQIAYAVNIGGMLSSNTIFTASQSPYNLTSTVQIPKGVTLKIEAGVRITGTGLQDAFLVAGKLEIVGTKDNPVRIQDMPSGNIFRTIGEEPTINITNSLISNIGTLWKNDASMNKATFVLANSEVIGGNGPIYVWYPKTFTVSGSYFYDTGGFSIGIQKCNGGAQLADDVHIMNNTFDGKPGYTYNGDGWIVGWVTYCDGKIDVTNNYFKNPVGTIISVAKGYKDPINIRADGNYWGSLAQSKISNLVLDATDSLDYYSTVSLSTVLSTIPNEVPINSIILQERQKIQIAKAAASKKTTITCVKGKSIKKVTDVKPVCPKGYKKK